MPRSDDATARASVIDPNVTPRWLRTGYTFFPYAAHQFGQWWVLRSNLGFPEHDRYTLFIDGRATADITGDVTDERPFVAGVAALKPCRTDVDEPALDADTAAAVVGAVARYANYASEVGDPCMFCSDDNRDGMERR